MLEERLGILGKKLHVTLLLIHSTSFWKTGSEVAPVGSDQTVPQEQLISFKEELSSGYRNTTVSLPYLSKSYKYTQYLGQKEKNHWGEC